MEYALAVQWVDRRHGSYPERWEQRWCEAQEKLGGHRFVVTPPARGALVTIPDHLDLLIGLEERSPVVFWAPLPCCGSLCLGFTDPDHHCSGMRRRVEDYQLNWVPSYSSQYRLPAYLEHLLSDSMDVLRAVLLASDIAPRLDRICNSKILVQPYAAPPSSFLRLLERASGPL